MSIEKDLKKLKDRVTEMKQSHNGHTFAQFSEVESQLDGIIDTIHDEPSTIVDNNNSDEIETAVGNLHKHFIEMINIDTRVMDTIVRLICKLLPNHRFEIHYEDTDHTEFVWFEKGLIEVKLEYVDGDICLSVDGGYKYIFVRLYEGDCTIYKIKKLFVREGDDLYPTFATTDRSTEDRNVFVKELFDTLSKNHDIDGVRFIYSMYGRMKYRLNDMSD